MAHPSFSMSDELLESLDKTINALDLSEDNNLPDNVNRSEIVRALLLQWIEENRIHPEGTLPIDDEYDPDNLEEEFILELLPDVDNHDE